MDLKVFMAAFGIIFLAELGDKTQLANLMMSAKTKSPWIVFLASVLAFSLLTLITVFLGEVISKYVSPHRVKYVAAFLFIVVGILMLAGKI
ncbi:MAG: hypothetical protein GF375_07005 [Candidatus Omnitrophica bacterium]|nr:hypothetical protein [Candidatus Omnitrophota bacterium]MBD3269725.1 hypothetical protein [Candidatus Omnitrophota bacterium]